MDGDQPESGPMDDVPSKTLTQPARRVGGRVVSVATYRYPLVILWIAIIVAFGVVEPSTFLTTGNLGTVLGSQAVLVVLTLGLIVPLTAGDYDLSVASVLMLSSDLLGVLNAQDHINVLIVCAICVATGLGIGLLNGLIVTWLDLDPFVVTLGMATVIQGLVFYITGLNTISGISSGLVGAITSTFLGIPVEFYYGVVLAVIIWVMFNYSTAGRKLLFVGRGRGVARLNGIGVTKVRVLALVASGGIASLAGVMYAGTTGSADPSSGATYLLPAFAAAFLGVTTFQPGRFNAWGSFVAVYTLVTGITGLELLGVGSFVQDVFYGGALVLAMIVAGLVRRRQGKEAAVW